MPIVQIKLVADSTLKYDTVASSEGFYKIFKRLTHQTDREEFWVAALNVKNKPMHIQLISVGSLTMTIVHPREVFKGAILANAASIIVAHNHPSGNHKPSNEDRALTKRLKESGDLLGIRLLDHIIVGGSGYYSFADKGGL